MFEDWDVGSGTMLQ